MNNPLITALFSTDYGLMSIAGIIFMLGMGVFFIRYFFAKMDEDEARVKAEKRKQARTEKAQQSAS